MKIDVWSDVVCPWCWLGRARLAKAIAALETRGERVEIEFHSFELDSRMPKDLDVSTSEMLAKKYGMGPAQVDAAHARLRALGEADGIEFRFDLARTANTFDAHRVVHLAKQHGKDLSMVDRLFAANFREGVRVSERGSLVRLAVEVGLDAAEVERALDEGRFADAVRADETEARGLGITGVPAFFFGGRVAVSGAQSVDVLLRAFEVTREKLREEGNSE